MIRVRRKTKTTVLTLRVGAVVLFLILFMSGPRVRFPKFVVMPELQQTMLPSDLEKFPAYFHERESHVPGLKPEQAKRIQFADPAHPAPTDFVFVVLHGFSASPKELSPLVENLGRTMHANVFWTRLAAHGADAELFRTVKTEDWLRDGEEALAVGHRLGKRVIVVGSSTGATLATWLDHRHPGDLAGLVFLSPNFGFKDPASALLTLPWGLQMARLVVGDYRQWKPNNELHGRYWTTRYPIECLPQLAVLVNEVVGLDLSQSKTPLLGLYTSHDEVLSVKKILNTLSRFGGTHHVITEVPGAREHVLAGDAVSPATTPWVQHQVEEFVRSLKNERAN